MGTDPIAEELLDRLKRLTTPEVADTNHEGVRILSPDIEPVHSGCSVVGTVRTVKLDPAALWSPVRTLDDARPGDVVVVDTGGRVDEAVWGELLSRYAAATGVAGMVTNGAVRDIDGIRDTGLPVFSRTRTPRGPSGNEEGETDVRVTVGETVIEPGDALVGDRTGVVVIERAVVDEIVTAAEAVATGEREVERRIDDGDSLGEAIGQLK